MRPWSIFAARVVPLLLLLLACSPLPRSFSVVSLQKAQKLLVGGGIAVVDALEVGARDPGRVPGGIRWRIARSGAIETLDGTPPVPVGPVLVVAGSTAAGYRSAAVLARAGSRPVWVVIPGNEQERSSLASALMLTKEVRLDDDS